MRTITFKIKRQDDPGDIPYWEAFVVERQPSATVLDALEAISINPISDEGQLSRAVVYLHSCHEGSCGACAMIINGFPRLACKVLLEDLDSPVKLEPLSKFPVIKDLKVDQTKLTDAISAMHLWIDAGEVGALSVPLRINPSLKDKLNQFSDCVICGACVEACPMSNDRNLFVGAFAFARAALIFSHPIGKFGARQKMDLLLQKGWLPECRGASSCNVACPKGIPLSEAITNLNWAANIHSIKNMFA